VTLAPAAATVAAGLAAPAAPPAHRIVIEPPTGWTSLQLREIWEFRELLVFLAWRDIKVRYKQTVLGASWAVLQPLFTMLVFSLFFGKLGNIPSEGLPYPLFAFAALVPWYLFAHGMTQAAESLVGSANLIKKVFFPRILVPLSCVLTGLADFCLTFLLLLGMTAFYCLRGDLTLALGTNLLFVPVFVLCTLATSLGAGLWLAALNVQFRDVRYTLSFLTQFWLFVTPIAYPSSLLPEPWRSLYGINPMAGVVEGFRWALLGQEAPPAPMLMVSTVMAVILLVSGAYYFRRIERHFADLA
jgi:lipopolysaccharide transport system permease protein